MRVMQKKEHVNLNVRVPKKLKEIIEKLVEYDLHNNMSEFVRDALREKLKREAPDLVQQFLEEW